MSLIISKTKVYLLTRGIYGIRYPLEKSIAKYTLKQKYVCASHLNGDTKTKKYQSQES